MFIRGRSLRSSGPMFYKCSTTATAIGRGRRSCSESQFADCASNFPTSQRKGFLFRRHAVQAAATGRRGKTAGPCMLKETRPCEAARSTGEGGRLRQRLACGRSTKPAPRRAVRAAVLDLHLKLLAPGQLSREEIPLAKNLKAKPRVKYRVKPISYFHSCDFC